LNKLYGFREESSVVDLPLIIHPYGKIETVGFGYTKANYVEAATGIRTYTEQIESDDIVEKMQAEVLRAECIVFLGFAYHGQNLSILKPDAPMDHKPVFGTAFGMSDADVDVVETTIASFFGQPMSYKTSRQMRLENKLKCAGLFDYYARSLSGGD
jgi:hypothetical protein